MTQTRLSVLYFFSKVFSFYRDLPRQYPKLIISRAIWYNHLRFTATSSAIVQMFSGGLVSGMPRSFGKRISRFSVNVFSVNSVVSEIVDKYAHNPGNRSGFKSNKRFCTSRRSIEISFQLNVLHLPFVWNLYWIFGVLLIPNTAHSTANATNTNLHQDQSAVVSRRHITKFTQCRQCARLWGLTD